MIAGGAGGGSRLCISDVRVRCVRSWQVVLLWHFYTEGQGPLLIMGLHPIPYGKGQCEKAALPDAHALCEHAITGKMTINVAYGVESLYCPCNRALLSAGGATHGIQSQRVRWAAIGRAFAFWQTGFQLRVRN